MRRYRADDHFAIAINAHDRTFALTRELTACFTTGHYRASEKAPPRLRLLE
jgi:hypothetical protein